MITNEYLIDIAKALNGESSITPLRYVGFGATEVTVTPSMTEIPDELLPRSSTTNTRESSPGNVLQVYGLKTGASVLSSTGEYVNSAALFQVSTGGLPRAVVSLPNLLHTTSFDIETTWVITISRR